ncbi:hypothetical protein ASD8599_01082 [Ascidiaceihabitans donghaensis]|uniref:Uncharacterized protein n=1 Tax=Ascidiaceihabitans donghaensis TaxID=1510460 RepID=A0A2R8BBQ4_9RHOB|nr:hypothetical protein [Ascidiaceihabitans donghaensis]SPH20346.1 hypothetical protein ASD8599_01082 [Ascidiaceihabitans donghaensis]
MTHPKPKLRKRHVDLLLLSIIRAHEHPDRTREEDRLADVRAALFGEKRTRGRTDAFDDLALFKILDANRKGELNGLRRAIAKRGDKQITPEWEAEITRDPKPIRTGAREFQELAGSAASEKNLEDRLRRKARTPLTNQEMAQIEALLDPDAPHNRTIIDILELLENLGVQSETIWDENP